MLGREAGRWLLRRLVAALESLTTIASRDLEWAKALNTLAKWDERERALVWDGRAREDADDDVPPDGHPAEQAISPWSGGTDNAERDPEEQARRLLDAPRADRETAR